ncbi:MAG: phosphotransferase family protein [Pseudobdellovibrionaceae bacterium]
MSDDIKTGVSGVVTSIKGAFGDMVLKNFKAPRPDNTASELDYSNEVSALQVLQSHVSALPFRIPQIVTHGVHETMETEYGPYAFIQMTKLANPLGNSDKNDSYYDDITEEDMQRQAYEAGRAAAHLHGLDISPEERATLTRDPVELIKNQLRNHPVAAQHPDLIERGIGLLDRLEGEDVFVHNDFHHVNLFAQSYDGPVEGICDFCFSGMGVRELDIRMYVGKYREAFTQGYDEVSDVPLNPANVDIMAEVSTVFKELYHRLEDDISAQQDNGIADTNAPEAGHLRPL